MIEQISVARIGGEHSKLVLRHMAAACRGSDPGGQIHRGEIRRGGPWYFTTQARRAPVHGAPTSRQPGDGLDPTHTG